MFGSWVKNHRGVKSVGLASGQSLGNTTNLLIPPGTHDFSQDESQDSLQLIVTKTLAAGYCKMVASQFYDIIGPLWTVILS